LTYENFRLKPDLGESGLMRVDLDEGGIQVMEHREPPRIAAGDRRFDGAIEEPASGFRLRAFDPFRDRRRIDLLRAGVMIAAALALTAILFYLGSRAAIAAVTWLHRQSQYQVAFDEIKLVQELPRWYRGGNREFLDRVRRGSGQSARLSQLEVRPDRLAVAFKLDPCVEEVVRVSYTPGRILVDLKFREPVAWVKPEKGQHLVDGEGRVLPAEDVDFEAAGPLLNITGVDLSPPADSRVGVVWKSKSKSGEVEQVDRRIVAAAGLARFLRQQGRLGGKLPPALQMIEIIVTDFGGRGLFLLNAKGTVFCWGRAPGAEQPRELTAMEKWETLRRWTESSLGQTLAEGDYWEFSRRGVSLVCTHIHGPHRRQVGPRSTTPES
jgi:hypothetical protein